MSAIPVQETNSVIAELPKPKGPGARLKAARLAKQLDLDLVAAQLHLSHDMLVALEADDYEHLPARVFVVGYLRNYARHVGLPPEAIIQALNNYLPVEETKIELPKVGTDTGDVFKPSVRAKRSSFSFVSLVLLIGAIGLFFAWQKGYITVSEQLVPEQLVNIPSQVEESIPSLPLPALPETVAVAIPQNQVEESAPLLEPEAVSLETRPTAVMDDTARIEINAAPDIPEATAAEATLQESKASAAVAPAPEILLSFSEVCWVDIRDSSGSYKYVNQVQPGTVKKLTGTAPYKILLGNAKGASLTINGEPFDLQRYTNANVARFSLDPATF